MCNMLVASDREEILKIAEELAARQIRHIDREQDDDEYMSDEDCDNLKDMICVLEKAACTRKLHFELEEMTAERLEAWRNAMFLLIKRHSIPHILCRYFYLQCSRDDILQFCGVQKFEDVRLMSYV